MEGMERQRTAVAPRRAKSPRPRRARQPYHPHPQNAAALALKVWAAQTEVPARGVQPSPLRRRSREQASRRRLAGSRLARRGDARKLGSARLRVWSRGPRELRPVPSSTAPAKSPSRAHLVLPALQRGWRTCARPRSPGPPAFGRHSERRWPAGSWAFGDRPSASRLPAGLSHPAGLGRPPVRLYSQVPGQRLARLASSLERLRRRRSGQQRCPPRRRSARATGPPASSPPSVQQALHPRQRQRSVPRARRPSVPRAQSRRSPAARLTESHAGPGEQP
jgi:hypothetical protein